MIKYDADFNNQEIILNFDLMNEFLDSLQSLGRKKETIRSYCSALRKLYEFLPEDKKVTKEFLEEWKESLKNEGYSASSINLMISAVNQLMKFCGKSEDGMLCHEHVCFACRPALSRSEYLDFLSFVQKNGSYQDYLLLKVFAVLGLHIRDLPSLSVEACAQGRLDLTDGTIVLIPTSVQNEILDYCERKEISSGLVFFTRSHMPLNRSNITHRLFRLADMAGIPQEKCSPNALHHMYEATQADIIRKMQVIYIKVYDSLFKTDQAVIEAVVQNIIDSLTCKP